VTVVPIQDHEAFEALEVMTVRRVLANARRNGLTEILIIGYEPDGSLFLSGHPPSPGDALWLMEQAKQKLLNPGG
jgi:hypothetical protein